MRPLPPYHAEILNFAAKVAPLMRLVETERDAYLHRSAVKQDVADLKTEMKEFLVRCEDHSAERAVRQALHYLPKLNTKPSARWFSGLYGAQCDLNYYLDHN